MPITEKTSKVNITPVLHDKALADRFAIFRKQYIDKTQIGAAKKLNMSQSNLWYIEHAMAPIKFELVSRLVKDFKLNQEWLDTGKGKATETSPAKANLITDLGALATEMDLLKKYLKIMEANQNHFIKIIEQQGKQIEALEAKIQEK